MARIRIGKDPKTIEYDPQKRMSLTEILRKNGIFIRSDCGGKGTCGQCKVSVTAGGKTDIHPACTYVPETDITVLLPKEQAADIQMTALPNDMIENAVYGIAVDLGTTTIGLNLYDLTTGRRLGTRTEANRQAAFGADVITRADYTMKHPEGLMQPSALAHDQIKAMTRALLQALRLPDQPPAFTAIAGNTIMQHLYAGLDPRSIVLAPYRPDHFFDTGCSDHLRLAPCISGYVGGDITAGLCSSGMYLNEKPSLLIDIGTNGEMAIGCQKGITCCSVATGPAFEGAQIQCGMTAITGAIRHVTWNGASLDFDIIGTHIPSGICGSGLIDLLAILLDLEIIDETGWLMPPEEIDDLPPYFEDHLEEDEDGNGILYLTEDHHLYLCAADIRKLQLAKSAVAAGIEILMETTGLCAGDLEHLYIAGSFGEHLTIASAVSIGMIPVALSEKILCIGNSSLAGASMLLLEEDAYSRMLSIKKLCNYVELSGNKAFADRFIEHMTF